MYNFLPSPKCFAHSPEPCDPGASTCPWCAAISALNSQSQSQDPAPGLWNRNARLMKKYSISRMGLRGSFDMSEHATITVVVTHTDQKLTPK